jgi:hypothetical protein
LFLNWPASAEFKGFYSSSCPLVVDGTRRTQNQVQRPPIVWALRGEKSMSIKFGLFLVEQGVISCDQFCGLLKIQQMAAPSPASVAIRRNLMTVKQVGQILGLIELNPELDFVEAGKRLGIIGATEQQRLDQEQQLLLPTIPFLLVECGLLRGNQVETLTRSFEKTQSKESAAPAAATQQSGTLAAERVSVPAAPLPSQAATGPTKETIREVVTPGAASGLVGQRVHAAQPLRQPKFVQRPQVAQTEEAYYG